MPALCAKAVWGSPEEILNRRTLLFAESFAVCHHSDIACQNRVSVMW